MELFNFSAGEHARINRALTFLTPNEVDVEGLSARTIVFKTENFEDECRAADRYFPGLGLENRCARLVFNPAREGSHKILINKAAITGLSYIHTLVTELVHLGNLIRYTADHGNIYRLEADQAIAQHYYEFLLWSKFQAMRLATRAHALTSWHEVNGEEPPRDGRYQFAQVAFPSDDLRAVMVAAQEAETLNEYREGLWELLEELAYYFGRLAFYQQEPNPLDLDRQFPDSLVEATVGIEHALVLYGILLQARDYPAWLAHKQNMRQVIVAMQERAKKLFETVH